MGYFLFLLVNAALFLRPEEILPQLNGTHLYELFTLSCLAVSFPRVVNKLGLRSLRANPINACIVGLMAVVVISNLFNYQSREELGYCFDFAKLVVYYFLLVAVVDTLGKLRGFVYYLAGLIFVLTALALLHYHDVINIAALTSYAERQWEITDEDTGQTGDVLLRLCAAGIFANPNDLSRILMVGILVSLYGLGDRRSQFRRPVWLALLGVFGYAMALTYSRGGFLCLVAALITMLWVRFGGRKTVILGLVLLPLLFVLFGGRQTQFSTSAGTAHTRIELWSDGFAEWRGAPLFGIGMNKYVEAVGIGAHNSFVQAYTELGFVGGTLFLGAFFLAVSLPYASGKRDSGLPPGELSRFRPYLIGILAGYAFGLTSSTRNYSQHTYTLLGLAAIYLNLVRVYLPASVTSLNGRLVRRVLLVSGLSVVGIYLFIRVSLAGG